MARSRRSSTLAAAALALLVGLTACTSEPEPAATEPAEGDPVRGGTLRLLGSGDLDHMDTASAYYVTTYTVLRATTRQLVSYPTTEDEEAARQVVPDLATSLPEPTDGGRTYRFRLREGAQWDAPGGARQITGEDVVRGLKRLCNPVRPTGAPGYFIGVVEGMEEFCAGFSQVPSTIPAIRDFLAQNEVSGLKSDGLDVEIRLVQPAADFLNILALPFASPVAEEMLAYLPDSAEFRQNTISSGPYKVERYEAERLLHLARNPAWQPESDDLRAAHVDRVEITLGADEARVQQALEAGTADLAWDTRVPTASVAALVEREDERLTLFPNGKLNPYLAINLESPNADGALAKVEVRRALNLAVDKRALVELLGGPALFTPHGQVLTPVVDGYEEHDPYATPGSAGDDARARQMLAEAGHPDGIDLVFLYRDRGNALQVAEQLRADLEPAGFRLQLKEAPPADFYPLVLQQPAARTAGEWDLAAPVWEPDWQGDSARSIFLPLLDGRQCGEGSTNYMCYSNPRVHELIDAALVEPDDEERAELWAEADRLVMADAPWVPLTTGSTPWYRSERVRNYIPFSLTDGNADVTHVWLEDPAPPG